ncbi:MAG: PaaI family thioesterase [Deltaproteobacteria bacterium]|nr:MAG: PaaI family thioesterase [Deltaproteobacteria bacterium]
MNAPENSYQTMMSRLLRGEIPPPAIATTIGFRPVAAAHGEATFVLKGDPARHANPMGTMHGGVMVDLGDAAMGFAMATTLDEGESFTTVDLHATYFRPVWDQELTATARVVKRSRSLGYIECEITDDGGALVCKVTSTCMVLRGDAARGR